MKKHQPTLFPLESRDRSSQRRSGSVCIRDMPLIEQPEERLVRLGPEALSSAELLAIILRSGVAGESALDVAHRLLAHSEGLAGLARTNFNRLMAERGIGKTKAAQLLAALELGRRITAAVPEEQPTLYTSADVASILMPRIGHLEQEHFCVLFLNARYQIMGEPYILYKGTLLTATIRPGEIFREAIRRNCAHIIVAHNHPSGDPTPSPDDIATTRQLVDAGRLLGIDVIDHLVIGQGRWVSMRDRRQGFSD
ncbi:MAG: DNA repair protein RadC [Chloroflexi bacterium]|nr:DNA repair protein RadC [Chloroflexota bacterium]